MLAFFSWIWKGIKSIGGVLLPMFHAPKGRIAKSLRWPLHIIVLILVLDGLYYLNYFFDLERSLRSPWPILHDVWLPLLFLLVYILGWLGLWLWKLLGPDHETSDFPDIDDGWHRAVQALNQANIDLKELPIFLLLGRPAAREALFTAANVQLVVPRSPRGDSPVHVYATKEAIYVACTASLLTHQADYLEQEAFERQKAAELAKTPAAKPSDIESTSEMKAILDQAQKEGRGPDQLTEEEKKRISELAVEPEPTEPEATPRRSFRHKELVQTYGARLDHLCRLIVRDRRPYCAINGILVIIPFATTEDDQLASQTATLCQEDLQAARDGLQVDCPWYLMVADLETTPGCLELIARSTDAQKLGALGRRFSLVPDVDPPEMPGMLDAGVHWICESFLPARVYSLFTTDGDDLDVSLEGNAKLYQFLWEMRDRVRRFSRIVTRGTRIADGTPPLLGGFYLAATGADASREQAFVAEAFREMMRNQNYVSWTSQALSDEANYRNWIRFGISTYVIGVCVLLFFGYLYWRQ